MSKSVLGDRAHIPISILDAAIELRWVSVDSPKNEQRNARDRLYRNLRAAETANAAAYILEIPSTAARRRPTYRVTMLAIREALPMLFRLREAPVEALREYLSDTRERLEDFALRLARVERNVTRHDAR
jgi:hypothetical protein